jgi:hypothetical protein
MIDSGIERVSRMSRRFVMPLRLQALERLRSERVPSTRGIVGAQLMARSRADIALYDSLIESYRTAGLLPA